jgi:hypothetical protein
MNDTTTLVVAALALAIALATGVEVIRLSYRQRDFRPSPTPAPTPPAREPATLRGSIRDLVRAFIRGAAASGVAFSLLLGLALHQGEITPGQALDKVEHYTVTAGGIFVDFVAAVRNGDSGEPAEDENVRDGAAGAVTEGQDAAPPGPPAAAAP